MTKYEKMCLALRDELNEVWNKKVGDWFWVDWCHGCTCVYGGDAAQDGMGIGIIVNDGEGYGEEVYVTWEDFVFCWLPSLEDLLNLCIPYLRCRLVFNHQSDIEPAKRLLLEQWAEAKHNKTWDEEKEKWVKQ